MWDKKQVDEIYSLPFTQADVLEVTGLEGGSLQNWINRGVIKSEKNWRPGTGKRRAYFFPDIIRLAAVAEVRRAGIPIAECQQFAEIVEDRVRTVILGVRESTLGNPDGVGMVICVFSKENIDKAVQATYEDDTRLFGEERNDEICFLVLKVDALISGVTEQLRRKHLGRSPSLHQLQREWLDDFPAHGPRRSQP